MKNDEQLVKAVKNFFELNSHLCPEAMMLELAYLRVLIPRVASKEQSVEEILVSFNLVDTVIEFIKDCQEC